jgi:sugar phosphate isomerase/epimerase
MPFTRIVSTLGCPGATLEEALALAEAHGLAGIELRALGGSLDLAGALAAEFGTPAALARQLGERAGRIVAFASSLRLIDSTAEDRARFQQLLPWAEALGVRWLRVFDGGSAAEPSDIEEAAEVIRWWRQIRGARGWSADLMVETHDALVTSGALARFLAAAPETALLWDAHHTWRKGGEDPVATWRALGPAVVHIHVKDSVARPSARHPFTYVLPGAGEFPMAPLLAELRGGFSGALCLEWERYWNPELPDLGAALRAAAERRWW